MFTSCLLLLSLCCWPVGKVSGAGAGLYVWAGSLQSSGQAFPPVWGHNSDVIWKEAAVAAKWTFFPGHRPPRLKAPAAAWQLLRSEILLVISVSLDWIHNYFKFWCGDATGALKSFMCKEFILEVKMFHLQGNRKSLIKIICDNLMDHVNKERLKGNTSKY